jgi:hypothetical protein
LNEYGGDKPLHRLSHFAPPLTLPQQLDSQMQDISRRFQQTGDSRRHLTNGVSEGGIAAPPSNTTSRVDADYVPLLEHAIARNAVHDLLVYRDTRHSGERHWTGNT